GSPSWGLFSSNRPEIRNPSATSSLASMRPVNVTGDPASCFSTVTVRTGRTCGAAASESGRHPTRSADNANANQMVRAGGSDARDCAMLCDIWLVLFFVDQTGLRRERL